MKSRIWHLATVGLLCVSVTGQVLADERGDGNSQAARPNGEQHWQGGGGQPRGEHHQGRPGGGQWQQRPDNRPPMAIQPRPDAVQQTRGQHWGGNQNGQTGGQYGRPGGNNIHPNDVRWSGRPDGHGNGWGHGPQYRPGYVIDRFPGQYHQIPYRGQNFFFSSGYWYRPQGPRYVVVQPPYGIRVSVIPSYAREVWVGSSLLFLAAGAYYAYQPATQDYIVVAPPTTVVQAAPQPVSNGYDVVAYPISGQTPAQISQDRYDCYRWAVDQSRFDPAQAAYAPAESVVQLYRQTQGNCLSGRGYRVGG